MEKEEKLRHDKIGVIKQNVINSLFLSFSFTHLLLLCGVYSWVLLLQLLLLLL